VNVNEYLKFALRQSGDASNGRKLFEGPATCVACHRARGTGAQIGPDLSDVGTKYDRTFLIESILYPSKQILDGYHLTNITLKNKSSVNGFLRSQTADELLLVDAGGEKHAVKKSEVEKSDELNVSLMPEGLQSALSLAEFSDLVAYLESLKDKATASHP
jgi:putative heme-binding domain-containing protein